MGTRRNFFKQLGAAIGGTIAIAKTVKENPPSKAIIPIDDIKEEFPQEGSTKQPLILGDARIGTSCKYYSIDKAVIMRKDDL